MNARCFTRPDAFRPRAKAAFSCTSTARCSSSVSFAVPAPTPQHTQPDDVALDRTDGPGRRSFQAGGIHRGNDCLAQLDTRLPRHRHLLGPRTTHHGHDGGERSSANQLLDERVAHRSRCTENRRRLGARHEVPFVDVPLRCSPAARLRWRVRTGAETAGALIGVKIAARRGTVASIFSTGPPIHLSIERIPKGFDGLAGDPPSTRRMPGPRR